LENRRLVESIAVSANGVAKITEQELRDIFARASRPDLMWTGAPWRRCSAGSMNSRSPWSEPKIRTGPPGRSTAPNSK
jgi:hypothetical protein